MTSRSRKSARRRPKDAFEADFGPEPEPEPARVTIAGPVAPTLAAARSQMRPIYEKARAAGFQLGALLNRNDKERS